MPTIASMEPMLPDERQDLEDLATDLVSKASGLAGRLHPVLRASIGDLVRSMNCYYSNLIEGHNTLPIDIDRALKDDYAGDSIRGLHLQNPSTQGKLVSVMRGRVLDVAVDVRLGSPNFGRHVAVELNEDNRRQLWVPRGFAHGFAVLSETADFSYKCDNTYSPKDEVVVRWDDPAIGIAWGIENPSLSPRDAAAPYLAEVKNLPVGQT